MMKIWYVCMIYTKCKQYIFKPSRSHVQSYFFCRNFSIYNKQNSSLLNFCIDPYIHISKCHLPTCFRETLQQFHIFQDVEIQKLLILTKNLSRRCHSLFVLLVIFLKKKCSNAMFVWSNFQWMFLFIIHGIQFKNWGKKNWSKTHLLPLATNGNLRSTDLGNTSFCQ